MDITYTILLVTLANLIIGSFVFHKNPKNLIHQAFAAAAFILGLWSLAMFFYQNPIIYSSLWGIRIVYFFVILIAGSWGYFFEIFPRPLYKKRYYPWFFAVMGPVYWYILFFTDLWVVDAIQTSAGPETILNGGGYFNFGIFILLSMLWISFLSVKNAIRLKGLARLQIIYVFGGVILYSIFASIFDVIIPLVNHDSGYFWISAYFSLFFVGFTAYAIVKHRLMDVKFVLRRSFVYVSSLITLVLPIIGIQYLVIIFYTGLADVITVVLVIIAVLIFSPLKHYYYWLANKYFFSSLYDPQEVIAQLSDNLRSTLEVNHICGYITSSLVDAFHTKKVGILIFNQKNKEYQIAYNHGFEVGERRKFASDKVLHSLFIVRSKSIIVEEIDPRLYKKTRSTIDMLRELKVEIITPINIKDKNIAILVLGPKESGDMYNSEDLRVLEIVCAQAAVALQNALLYEESLAFGRKLKMEVKKATHDLRAANKRLIDLDKLKTEFMSMASHQLRTPLSGIKGHLSMMIEGDYGQVKARQKKVLQGVFDNNERLVRLVNVFLNISRIESGRLTLNKEKVHVEDLVDKAVFQMQTSAQSKNLYLKFVKPKTSTPELEVDQDKLMDVILNFIDNAIKYTDQGGITVNVLKDKQKVTVEVKDTGVGIDRQLLAKLFSKFTRGVEASKMSTTGAGLGLFIAKKIVELHGGRIKAESQGKGQGSTFSFELPVQ